MALEYYPAHSPSLRYILHHVYITVKLELVKIFQIWNILQILLTYYFNGLVLVLACTVRFRDSSEYDLNALVYKVAFAFQCYKDARNWDTRWDELSY